MDERLRQQQQRMDECAIESMALAQDVILPKRRANAA